MACVVNKYRMRALFHLHFREFEIVDYSLLLWSIERGWNPNSMLSTRHSDAADIFECRIRTQKTVEDLWFLQKDFAYCIIPYFVFNAIRNTRYI